MGSDVVEFTPIYDNAAETTGIAVGQIIYEILQWMVSPFSSSKCIPDEYFMGLKANHGVLLYRFMFLFGSLRSEALCYSLTENNVARYIPHQITLPNVYDRLNFQTVSAIEHLRPRFRPK